MSQRSMVVVGGMHRSGTSALAGALAAAGVNFGRNLKAAAEDNAKGFFEDEAIVALNEELLEKIFQSWDSCTPIASDVIRAALFPTEFDQACAIVLSLSDTKLLSGIKDPRLSLLRGFWNEVFAHCGVQTITLLCLRHPIEVAQSLYHRNRISLTKSCALWLKYTISALQSANTLRSPPPLIIDYQQAIEAPSVIFQQVLNALEGSIATGNTLYEKPFCDFFDITLAHGQPLDWKADDNVFVTLANELYTTLKQGNPDPVIVDALISRWLGAAAQTLSIDNEYQSLGFLEQHERDWINSLEASNKRLVHIDQSLNELTHAYKINITKLQEVETKRQEVQEDLQESLRRESSLFEQLQVAELERQHALQIARAKQDEAWQNYAALVEVKNSTSWKFSYPVRLISRLIQKLTGNG